jgi:hypothetical protein
MLNDPSSLAGFIGDGPSGCHFVFSSDERAGLDAVEAGLSATLASVSPTLASEWAGRLHFTNSTANVSLGGGAVSSLLDQWQSPQNLIVFGGDDGTAEQENASRLDCMYATGPWPAQTQVSLDDAL